MIVLVYRGGPVDSRGVLAYEQYHDDEKLRHFGSERRQEMIGAEKQILWQAYSLVLNGEGEISERYGWSAREKMKLRRRVALLALTGVVARGTFAFVVTPWCARNIRTRHGFLPAPGLSSVPRQILSDDMVPTTIEKFMQGEVPGLSKATLGEYLERGWVRIKGDNGAESAIRFRDELVFEGDTVAVLLPKLGSDVAIGADRDIVLDAAAVEWVSIPAIPRSSSLPRRVAGRGGG